MRHLPRLLRYLRRFLFEPKYRNRVFDLLDEHLGRRAAPSEGETDRTDRSWARGKSIYLVGGCELSYLRDHLETLGMEALLSFDQGTAGEPWTELQNPESPLHGQSFDFVVFSQYQPLMDLVLLVQRGEPGSAARIEEGLAGLAEQLDRAFALLRELTPAPVALVGYPLRYRPWRGALEARRDGVPSLRELQLRFELQTREVAARHADVGVVEPSLAFAGFPQDELLGSYDADGVNDHLTRRGAAVLGDRLVDMLGLHLASTRRFKVVALDLDGTLWGGILVEDGAGAIAVNAFRCRIAEAWARRGMILAVVSKNDPSSLPEIQRLLPPALVERVAVWKVSWDPKPHAVAELARELEVSFDAVAFFDDNPLERAAVAELCPGVATFDVVDFADQLAALPFEPRIGGTSGETRRALLAEQTERATAARTSGKSYEDFLASCEMRMVVRLAEEADLPRLAELCARTNQLNASRRRLSRADLDRRYRDAGSYRLVAVELGDRFGDFGLVGVLAIAQHEDAWYVEELAFSCRSMGRGVEARTLAVVADAARVHQVRRLQVDYLPSDRNQSLRTILETSGFVAGLPTDAEAEAGRVPYRLELAAGDLETGQPWLTVDDRLAGSPVSTSP